MADDPRDEIEDGPDPWRVMMARELADKMDAAMADLQAAVDGKADVIGHATVADFLEPCMRAVTYTLSRYVSAVTVSQLGKTLDALSDAQVTELQKAFHREIAIDLRKQLEAWLDRAHAKLVRLRKSGLLPPAPPS